VEGSAADVLWQFPEALADERAVDRGTGDRNPVIALEVPGDSLRAEVILGAQVHDLFDDLGRR